MTAAYRRHDERRHTMYIEADVHDELIRMAIAQDRSISQMAQLCIKRGLRELRKLPSVPKVKERRP